MLQDKIREILNGFHDCIISMDMASNIDDYNKAIDSATDQALSEILKAFEEIIPEKRDIYKESEPAYSSGFNRAISEIKSRLKEKE